MFSDYDRLAMQRALGLAARGLASTDPNPRVGCVIAHGTQTVAEGWHARAGEAHAEVVALQAAGEQAAGATVYVTFEPCCHHGRTPPCVEALTQAGVARVVYAATDPNPQVNGRGAEALRAAGIQVEAGLLEREALELNCGFVKRMQQGRPWVRLKLAMSLDGRSALASGASRWISGEAARADVQRWRARSSAILTGIGTVLTDDPLLDLRLPAASSSHGARQPLRVVLDRHLRTPPGARLFTAGGEVLILTAMAALDAVLDRLAELECNEVQVEAGATLAGELVRQSLVDELLVYMAPKLLGDKARPLFELPELRALNEAHAFTLIGTRQLGDDLRLRLRPRVEPAPAVSG